MNPDFTIKTIRQTGKSENVMAFRIMALLPRFYKNRPCSSGPLHTCESRDPLIIGFRHSVRYSGPMVGSKAATSLPPTDSWNFCSASNCQTFSNPQAILHYCLP